MEEAPLADLSERDLEAQDWRDLLSCRGWTRLRSLVQDQWIDGKISEAVSLVLDVHKREAAQEEILKLAAARRALHELFNTPQQRLRDLETPPPTEPRSSRRAG